MKQFGAGPGMVRPGRSGRRTGPRVEDGCVTEDVDEDPDRRVDDDRGRAAADAEPADHVTLVRAISPSLATPSSETATARAPWPGCAARG